MTRPSLFYLSLFAVSCSPRAALPLPIVAGDVCYSTRDAVWDSASANLVGSQLDALPYQIRLTETSAARHPALGEGAIILGDLFPWDSSRVAYFEYPARSDSMSWRQLGPDSILVGEGGGFFSFYIRGVVGDDGIVGSVLWSVDNVPYQATAEIRAPVVACSTGAAAGI